MRLPWLQRVTGNQGSTPEREPEKRLPHPRKAAGTQITHSQHGEVVTKNNEAVLYEARHRNGYNLNPLTRINWRASLVPAAAVIPAPIAYIKVVAVKKLVVGSAAEESGPPLGGYCFSWPNSPVFPWCSSLSVIGGRNVYFE